MSAKVENLIDPRIDIDWRRDTVAYSQASEFYKYIRENNATALVLTELDGSILPDTQIEAGGYHITVDYLVHLVGVVSPETLRTEFIQHVLRSLGINSAFDVRTEGLVRRIVLDSTTLDTGLLNTIIDPEDISGHTVCEIHSHRYDIQYTRTSARTDIGKPFFLWQLILDCVYRTWSDGWTIDSINPWVLRFSWEDTTIYIFDEESIYKIITEYLMASGKDELHSFYNWATSTENPFSHIA